MEKKVTCQICDMKDHTDNEDLNGAIHKGFTIGNGKRLYWYLIWHSTGNVTVYPNDADPQKPSGRYLKGDQLITIHWK